MNYRAIAPFAIISVLFGCQTVPQKDVVKLAPEVLNEGTGRAARTKYLCEMATMPSKKPLPGNLDSFRIVNGNFGVADLYGNGSIDVVSGFLDESSLMPANHHLANYFEGNEDRTKNPTQYMFFSPDSDFVIPENTKFNLARNIVTGDFNGDGVDDLFFVQTGVENHPLIPHPNKVMVSSPNGYKVTTLPGPKSWWHGGAVGDIDNDGDIDLVATPNKVNGEPTVYINDGTGKFKYRNLNLRNIRGMPKNYYNAQFWDVDADGALDLILGGDSDNAPLAIYWGKGNGDFDTNSTLVPELTGTMQDLVFGDFDNDGVDELLVLSSKPRYAGFEINLYELGQREILPSMKVFDHTGFWYPYFTACDLANDGDLDIVIENFDQLWFWNPDRSFEGLNKLVWENDNGSFKGWAFGNLEYSLRGSKDDALEKAAAIGVTLENYVPPQIYYPSADGKRFSSVGMRAGSKNLYPSMKYLLKLP